MFDRYLITGATGFLGRAVVQALTGGDIPVRALVLPGDPLSSLLPEGVEQTPGDVTNPASLEDFFRDAGADTCLIHCAGMISIASRPGAKIYHVNVEGTNALVHQCFRHQVGRMVYVSSVHALPEKPHGQIITEEADFSPEKVTGAYAQTKAMATRLVLAAAGQGLNASVVFPSGLIGPGSMQDDSFTLMARRFLQGKLPFAVRGGYDFADVRDVAKGIIACAAKGRKGEGYILSGRYMTIREMLAIMGRAAGVKHRPLYLPLGLAKLAAPHAERKALRQGTPLFFTPYAVGVLGSNGRFSRDKAERELGYTVRGMEETLGDMAGLIMKE